MNLLHATLALMMVLAPFGNYAPDVYDGWVEGTTHDADIVVLASLPLSCADNNTLTSVYIGQNVIRARLLVVGPCGGPMVSRTFTISLGTQPPPGSYHIFVNGFYLGAWAFPVSTSL